MQTAYLQSGKLIASKLYDIASDIPPPASHERIPRFLPRCARKRLEHTPYEEQTVTNGQAISSEDPGELPQRSIRPTLPILWFSI